MSAEEIACQPVSQAAWPGSSRQCPGRRTITRKHVASGFPPPPRQCGRPTTVLPRRRLPPLARGPSRPGSTFRPESRTPLPIAVDRPKRYLMRPTSSLPTFLLPTLPCRRCLRLAPRFGMPLDLSLWDPLRLLNLSRPRLGLGTSPIRRLGLYLTAPVGLTPVRDFLQRAGIRRLGLSFRRR